MVESLAARYSGPGWRRAFLATGRSADGGDRRDADRRGKHRGRAGGQDAPDDCAANTRVLDKTKALRLATAAMAVHPREPLKSRSNPLAGIDRGRAIARRA